MSRLALWMVVLVVVAALPPPDAAADTGWMHIAPPREGMVLQVTDGEDDATFTFMKPQVRWVGHFERRPTVLLDGADGQEGWLFDLETNRLLMHGDHDPRMLGAEGPLDKLLVDHGIMDPDVSRERYRMDLLDHVFDDLPEWTLWNRFIRPGTAEEIPMPPIAETPQRLLLTTGSASADGMAVHVTRELSMPALVIRVEWSFTIDAATPFGHGRTRSVTFLHDNGTVYGPHPTPVPITVLDAGNDTLPFGGWTGHRLTADRDRTFTYGPVAAVPYDPDPYPFFDVQEAARLMLSLDDEDVRVFLSQAEAPFVSSAFVHWSGGPLPLGLDRDVPVRRASWTLLFADASGALLHAELDGWKMEGAPFVVEQGEAVRMLGEHGLPEVLEGLQVAALGDVVRRAHAAFAAAELTVSSLSWRLSVADSASGRLALVGITGFSEAVGDLNMETVQLEMTSGTIWGADRIG